MLHAYKIDFSINNLKYNFIADLPETFNKNLKEKYKITKDVVEQAFPDITWGVNRSV